MSAELDLWFDDKYGKHLALPDSDRSITFKKALQLLRARGGQSIVETGCVRQKDDWGAGNSTMMFCDFVAKFGGRAMSLDNNQQNLKLCTDQIRDLHGPLFEQFAPFHTDSVQGLIDLATHQIFGKIDLLYLDSFDYPDYQIAMKYGKTYEEGWKAAKLLPSSKVLYENGPILLPCQEHCLKEIKAAVSLLHDQSIIVIDDNLPGGGKGRLAQDWLINNGWKLEIEAYQSLFIK